MFEEIKALLESQLMLDGVEITPESRIKDDLGADSLDILEMLMSIEETHGVTIPDEELAKIETVQDIVDFMEQQ